MEAPRRKVLVAAIALVALQAGAAATLLGGRWSGTDSAFAGLPLDDGWIHLVYARNLLEHGEISYNPGEPEVGLTSPLWVALLAPVAGLPHHGPAVAAKLISAAMAALLCLLAAALARDLAGDLAGLVTGAVVALDPVLAFSAASGMEVPLASALAIGVLLAVRKRRILLAGALLGLGVLARPECGVMAVVLVPWCAVLVRRKELTLGRSLLAAGLAALVVAPFVAYCLHVTGRPLPNTFYIKGTLDLFPVAGLRVFASGVLDRSLVLGFGAGAVLYAWGCRDTLRRRGLDAIAIAVAPWVFVLAVVATRNLPVEEAQTYYFTRYLHPALPMLALFVGCGAASLARWSAGAKKSKKKKTKKRKKAPTTLHATRARSLAVALAVVSCACAGLGLVDTSREFSWNTQNIEEMQVRAGRWVAQNTPDDAVVAASDAGAIRFFGRRRVIDIMGLNYHPAVDDRREGRLPVQQILEQEHPSHVAVLHSWFPRLERSGRFRQVFEARARRYTVAAAAQDRFVVYEVAR